MTATPRTVHDADGAGRRTLPPGVRWVALRVDPVGVAMAAAALAVFVAHGFQGRMTRDVAVYAYAGQQVAQGVPPYEEILNRAGPLAHLVPGAGALAGRVLGVDDLLAMRVTMAVLSVLAVWAAYVLGRTVLASRGAGALTAAALLSFHGFVTYATAGPREKTTVVLLVLLALTALARHRWTAAGALTALATLTWQGAFLPLAAGALAALVVLPDRRLVVPLARWAAAGLAVLGAAVAYLALVGALPEFWEGFYVVNAHWTHQRGVAQLIADPDPLVTGYGWSLLLVVLGLAGALVVGVRQWRTSDGASGARSGPAALVAGTVVTLVWSAVSFEGWPDAMVMLPYAAYGVAAVTCLACLALTRLPRPVAPGVVIALVTAAVLAAAARGVLDHDTGLVAQRRHHDAVLAVLGGDVDLLAVGNPEPLVLGHDRNPLRYQIFSGGQEDYLRDTYPGGLRGLAREIAAMQPTVLTVRGVAHMRWLRPVLRDDYEWTGGRPDRLGWFASTSRTTPAQRAAMLRAARQTLPDVGRTPVRRSVP